MLPGFVLMFALSWLYFTIDISQSALGPIFIGVQVAVIALIVRAVQRIGAARPARRPALGNRDASAVARICSARSFWMTLPAGGPRLRARPARAVARSRLVVASPRRSSLAVGPDGQTCFRLAASTGGPVAEAAAQQRRRCSALFLSGLKAGLLTFGGAYTVIPFLRDDAVGERLDDATRSSSTGLRFPASCRRRSSSSRPSSAIAAAARSARWR